MRCSNEKMLCATAWLVLALGAVKAAPLTTWTVDQNGAINSGLNTANPVIGDGSAESADAAAFHGDFPAIILGSNGDSITFTGTVTLTGISASFQNFRFGLFDHGASTTINGWLGYFTSNSSGTSSGQIRERNAGNSDLYVGNTGSISITTTIDPQNDPITDGTYSMLLKLTRDGNAYDITASLIGGSGGNFSNVWTVNDRTPVTGDVYRFDRVGILLGNGLNADRAAFSNLDVSFASAPVPVTARLFGIDFNKNDAPAAPTQGGFRVVAGSSSAAANEFAYAKQVGPYPIDVVKAGAGRFEFQGANADATRDTPGGETTRSFAVSDFIASRDGAITLRVHGLPAGNYYFRSDHLDPFNGASLGYAEGASATTRTTIEARIGGVLKGSVQPTTLGAAGLNTTFITDANIPAIAFTFGAVAGQPVEIVLSGTDVTVAGDRFVFLNAFEIFLTE